MSYYDQHQQPPVGVPPPQGYPPKDAYPPPGYPVEGYPQGGYASQAYPPQYAQQPPRQETGFLEGCIKLYGVDCQPSGAYGVGSKLRLIRRLLILMIYCSFNWCFISPFSGAVLLLPSGRMLLRRTFTNSTVL
ncbi:hypothetical protein Pint_27873 [Pistacia integerrima]|uniref:Uncharacterized protein n=1 Tax=Pistacia integerrima TaxID=434235 RepID=A0ACC0YUP8_9ROSI|nr:hypothetical protein Pint_27873 [Pistacia integerrima]